MNRQADVVIIGGGIIGSTIAWELAKRNIDVMLLEKDDIAFGQSSRAWGFVRQQRRHPAELPLMIEANRMWPTLSAELEADFEWTQQGIMAVADSEERMSYYRNWYEETREFGVESRLLSTREVRELNPDMQGAWVGGIYTPNDGHAEPGSATRAFANAASRLGAQVHTGVTVDGIDVSAGSVQGVRANGEYIKTNTVICAAGTFSSRLGKTIGLNLPQLSVRQTVVEVDPRREISQIATWTPGVAFRQRPGGTMYLARPDDGDFDVDLDSLRYVRNFLPNFRANRNAFRLHFSRPLLRDLPKLRPRSRHWRKQFHQSVGVEPEVNEDVVARCRHNFVRLFPHIGNPEIIRTWGGVIDTMPDALPVMGESPEVAGFVWATGFSGHGFGIGPALGKAMAQLIENGSCEFDLVPFSPARFTGAHEFETTKIA
jgi:glycine/D-amino acid oxidase-like deaminating enzyme